MMYRHVFDKTLTEFRGILQVFVNFVGLRGNLAAPRPRKISEALYNNCKFCSKES